MAAGIVYLDVDDEITSAASRIRTASGTKVALVVPYGSRIATSRMNFRLLSREALVSNRRLSIVAGDAAARSLAASAGLPVFATVGEYEASIAPADQPAGGGSGAPGRSVPGPASGGSAAAAGLAASATVSAIGPAAGDAAGSIPQAPGPQAPSVGTDTSAGVASASAPVAGDDVSAPSDVRGGRRTRAPKPVEASALELEGTGDGSPRFANVGEGLRRRIRGPVVAAVGVLALAVIVLAVGAYVFLPSATITVTPRREPIGPIELTVSADPTATAVDATAGVVPALRLDVPVQASQTFTTTGTHVEESTASGSVTFTNYDFTRSNTVPSGSVVATEGGIRFKTAASISLDAATRLGTTIIPTTQSVAVAALKPGPDGNVPPNAIRIVPQGEDPNTLSVNNPDGTTGGSRTETPQVSKAEVDKAVAGLRAQLQAAFNDAVRAGAGAPSETTVFPGTAVLGTATPSVDPQTLVGRAVPTFDLGFSASGTVIAVDPRPVRTIAEAQLRNRVGQGHRIVDGSIQVEVGAGTVGEDGQVTFQATARATRVAIVDAEQLRALVKGKTTAEAEAALTGYGVATVELWPSWVTIVTGIDARLTITVEGGSPGPTGSPAPSAPLSSPRAAASSGPTGSAAASLAPAGRSPGSSGGSAAP